MWITLDFSAKTQILGQQTHAYEYKSTSYTHELPSFWGNDLYVNPHIPPFFKQGIISWFSSCHLPLYGLMLRVEMELKQDCRSIDNR